MSSDTPSGPPPSGPPETLDFGGGEPLPPNRGGRRTVLLVVGAVAAVAVAGASWAAWSFFSTGPQPAEALPGSTIAYVSIDLDPSGGQKIEALRTLSKFPAFEEHVGLDTDDDVREWIYERVQGDCDDLDYADDIEPWLGDRFGLAAVDVGDASDGGSPAAVFVLQVSDEGAADEGLQAIRECNDAAPDEGAWVIRDGWVVLAETEEIAEQVADDAAKGSLADDEDYQHWTDEAGDSGVLTMYAAPEAGTLLAEIAGAGVGVGGEDFAGDCAMDDEGNVECSESSGELDDTIPVPVPEEATKAFEEFRGAAATIRFDDGGLELEVAADPTAVGSGLTSGDDAGEVASSLPDDTIAALALSFGDGWVDDLLEQVAETGGGSVGDLVDEVTATLGIDLPEDAEAVVGDAIALAVGPDFDPASLDSGSPDLPGVGVKIIGDPDEVDAVLDKLRTAAAGADEGVLDSDAGDDAVAVGPDADYRAQLLEDGDLGGSDTYRRVVEHSDDAAAILFVDLDGGDEWISELAGDDEEVRENLEPLDALGLSAWRDDETAHAVVKITSD
jgi:uncharacterized protein DUF3352